MLTPILTEFVVLALLLIANGVFAMSEIALISARKTRLKDLAARGDARARLASEMAESPSAFLSTVQIGITLVGILAGAFGGATIAEQIAAAIQPVPGLGPYARGIALACVVVGITFLSLVFGELIPKRIGLAHPEGIALAISRPMHRLSSAAGPIVRLLTASSDLVLRLLGIKPAHSAVTEDEVKGLMQEGLRAGAFQKFESEMVENVLELDRLPVRDIMTPRPKIIWIHRDEPHEAVWHKIVVSGHSYFPVYGENRDRVVGILSVKAIYANLAANTAVKVSDLMMKPQVVPATQNVIQLLELFKQSGRHVALVADEFGTIVGLVTLSDIMEAIVGEALSQEERAKPSAQKRADGSWLIDAMIEVDALESVLPGFRCGTDRPEYKTLAGYIVKQLGRLPHEGETVEAQGYAFEVLDMDRHRVDKVLVTRPNSPKPSES